MPKLSPTYREDDVDSLPNDVRAYLDQHYLPTLENTTKQNPKLLVVFAGGNAVGKSTLAKRISQELNGVILENDAIKKWLLRYNPDINQDDLDTFTWKYAMNLYGRLDSITQNGLIIRDGIIHWYFDRILPIFEAQGYPVFIISMEPSTVWNHRLKNASNSYKHEAKPRLQPPNG